MNPTDKLVAELEKQVEVKLPLGSLNIEIGEDGNAYMEGPSEKVIEGTFFGKEKNS